MAASKKNMCYLAIIGDMKDSKNIPNRNKVQKKLQGMLNEINNEYKESIEASFTIVRGDEIQGLMHTLADASRIIERIEQEMYPVMFRFGLGVGKISTDMGSDSLSIDGPAYHYARDMINGVKASERKKCEPKNNIMIKIQGDASLSKLLNIIYSLLYAIKTKWTPRQKSVIRIYQANGTTQANIASVLGIHQSNVQRALSASDYYRYKKTLDELECILGNYNMNLGAVSKL